MHKLLRSNHFERFDRNEIGQGTLFAGRHTDHHPQSGPKLRICQPGGVLARIPASLRGEPEDLATECCGCRIGNGRAYRNLNVQPLGNGTSLTLTTFASSELVDPL